MRVAHVVVTDDFAGTERYVADVAAITAKAGHHVAVFGGAAASMTAALGGIVEWTPAATRGAAVRALGGAGRFDLVHAHLTDGEAAAVVTRGRHRGRVVATRHIAGRRGASAAGRLVAPYLATRLDAEIAISQFVADAVGLPSSSVLHNGVAAMPPTWDASARTVVMAQRLEPEKDTATGVRAWAQSGLAAHGWQLAIAGAGSQRRRLEQVVADELIEGVTFLGPVTDMDTVWARAGMLLATATAEPLGLSVLEAMAAGIPVVASLAGGHVETIGQVEGQRGFACGDAAGAAASLVALADDDDLRARLGAAGRLLQQAEFDLDRHVVALLACYESVLA